MRLRRHGILTTGSAAMFATFGAFLSLGVMVIAQEPEKPDYPPSSKSFQEQEQPTLNPPSNEDRHVGYPSGNLSPEILRPIEHKTMGIRDKEREAYYQVLSIAKKGNNPKQIQMAQRNQEERRKNIPRYRDNPDSPFPTFVDLFKNPEAWHGRLVTLHGHVRRIESYGAGENPYGLTTLYEAWIYTEDSQTNPAVVVCTEIPTEMPRGDPITEEASVTGYFFKMYGYRAQDTTRIAPMILSQRVIWHPARQSTPAIPPGWIAGGVIALTAAGVWFYLRSARQDRLLRAQRHTRSLPIEGTPTTEPPTPDLNSEKPAE